MKQKKICANLYKVNEKVETNKNMILTINLSFNFIIILTILSLQKKYF